MKYEEMSDFEINREVALLINNSMIFTNEDKVYLDTNDNSLVDYCDNPSDAWQIIVENKINIEFFGERVKASISIDTSFGSEFINGYDENCIPLRAAMICFLKMKDAEK